MGLHLISDSLLLQSYQEAIDYNLDRDFIKILEEELLARGIITVNEIPK
ncbi:hypothetical protein BTS2_2728 [Bacillus sp. TS-2]|nr:hypothetical protein BTS2_2728 [Bacillus sp. TS-2]